MHRSIEWAAGLFEGEGCMTWRDKEHKRPYLKLTMTDFDVVQKFAEIVNCGSLTSVDKKKVTGKISFYGEQQIGKM